MRILIIAPFGEGFLANSYRKALESNGHEIYCFDSDRAYFKSGSYARNRFARRLLRSKLWNKLNFTSIEVIRSVGPNLVLVFKGAFLHPETIRLIRTRENIPIVNYYPDNPYCGVPLSPYKTSAQRKDIVDCLREYTSVYIWSKHVVQRLTRDRVNSFYLPFGVDSETYNSNPEVADECFKKQYEIVFVGQRNQKRDRDIAAISKHRVAVWGPLWEKATNDVRTRHLIRPERAFGRDCASIYAHSSVALNIVDDLNMPGHNMRTFEIPACGGVMLSTYTEEQAEFFPEGEAAFYYRQPTELDDIIDRLLGDKETQKRIRQNAIRIARDHDYRIRARDLLRRVFG